MQEREEKKQNRIAQQEREIMERERGIMGTGNEGTIHIQTHTHTHSYNRHQPDPPESSISLLSAPLVARIRTKHNPRSSNLD